MVFSTVDLPSEVAPSLRILNAILNASADGILIVDSSMRITAANVSAQAAFGRQIGPLVGRRLSEVIRDLSLHEIFRDALGNNEAADLRFEFTGHEKRVYNVQVAPIELEDRHAIGFFYDTTQIERLETVRQEFLSNISHELRTPLTSILAFVETLEDGALDDPDNNRRFLGVIRRNAERMHALIDDIAELSLIETGHISLEPKGVRLSNVVDEIFATLSSRAAVRNIELVNRVDAAAVVRADPTRLEQMLTNLIDNAIKFNRDPGEVIVDLTAEPKRNKVSVADTGDGIVPENLQRIFERFYRIDRGRTREIGGTGLGLAIVKHLARLHGGDVSVTSNLGEGTVFTVELPAH